jgi:hypothetical protein
MRITAYGMMPGDGGVKVMCDVMRCDVMRCIVILRNTIAEGRPGSRVAMRDGRHVVHMTVL